MFFDSLGHGFKDGVIILFIIFTLVLSVYIMILNTRVNWWVNNYQSVSQTDKKQNGTEDIAVILSGLFMGIIILFIIYAIYEFYTKGKMVGLNRYGRR